MFRFMVAVFISNASVQSGLYSKQKKMVGSTSCLWLICLNLKYCTELKLKHMLCAHALWSIADRYSSHK